MREIVYYSSTAVTTGKFGEDLMKAGRMDIVLHAIISAFFISNEMRDDKLEPQKNKEIMLSKKDLLWIVKKLLYKCRQNEKTSPFVGYSVEKKNLINVLGDISKSSTIYILDENGEDIRDLNLNGNETFVLGDQDGIPRKILKDLKKKYKTVSVGKRQYLASQVITLVHNELDRVCG